MYNRIIQHGVKNINRTNKKMQNYKIQRKNFLYLEKKILK